MLLVYSFGILYLSAHYLSLLPKVFEKKVGGKHANRRYHANHGISYFTEIVQSLESLIKGSLGPWRNITMKDKN